MKKRIYAFALVFAMLMSVIAVPAAAETLTGDVLDDEMGYADINAVPWGTNWTSQRIEQPEGFTGAWADTTTPKVGAVEVKDGKIRTYRTGTLTNSDTVTVSRVLSTSAQPANDMTLEYEYMKEDKVKVYVNIASPTSWKGPLAITHLENGTFAAAGSGASLSGGNNITATGKVKVTIHLHKKEGNADVYVNDQLLKKGYQYDTRYGDFYDAGKVNFVLQNGTEMNQGVTINYIRYMETAEYANIAMAKDAASVDVTGLPKSGAAITENITLPTLPQTLSYGSTGVWESSDDSVLNAQTGVVTRSENDKQVTLSLKLSKFNEVGETVTQEQPTLSFRYTVTGTKAESGTPGTLPVSLAGDVLDDEMGYADINAVPWGYWRNGAVGNGTDNPAPYLFMYTTGGVNQPAGFNGTWYDDESKATKSGTIAVENGNLKLTRTAAKNAGDTISLNKFLTTGTQPADKMTVEFEYEKETGAKMQIGIQSPDNWRGALAVTQNANGTFSAAGNSSGTVNGSITSSGTTKITIHLDKGAKKADIYVNDQLLVKGYGYDTRYDGYYDAGKLGFTILKDSDQNKSVTIHYIRFMETAEYANIALAKDAKATIDVTGLPQSGATLENNLTLPTLNTLPYGSIPYLESSDDSILNAETGTITQRLEEQNVTLTLKLKKLNENGEYTISDNAVKQWNYTVAKSTATLQDDMNALRVNDLLGSNAAADSITTALTLPNTGKYAGSDITWSMLPEDAPIDLETGAVTRPVYGDDVPVKLMATLENGSETLTKEFDIVILTQPSFVKNLALGKPATASAVYAEAWGATEATDGNTTTTRWASRGSNNWIYVDLGAPTKVSALRFYEFAYRITAFVVEYSDDAQNWTAVKTVTGLPSSGTGNRPAYTTEFPAATARYWRLRQTAGSADISIFEVELYDTTQRFYESAVSVNDEALGSVQRTGGPGYTVGAEVVLSAQAGTTGKFIGWQLPEGLTLMEGTAQSPDIKYAQPQKNIEIVAEFEEKPAASIDVESAVYDKHEESENHKNIVVNFTAGDYVLQNIRCGKDVLEEGTQYTKKENVITLLQSWLETLSGEQTIVFQTDGGTQPSLKLEIGDSNPTVLIWEDLAAITKPDYQIQDGMTIPAVGPLHGSDIIVTSSNESALQVVRETQNGQLVNKLVVKAAASTNVTLTISGKLDGATASLPEIRCAVRGKGGSNGSGSGGSGGGGGNTVRPSGSGVVNYGTGTVPAPVQPNGTTPVQSSRFGDMPRDYWAHDYVELLVEKGIVSGDDKGNFAPEQQVTREEFVKMIVLTLGLATDSVAVLPFEDVAADDWSYPYIAAAYEAGIISGTGENVFGIGATMSRQDIAVVTARALDAAQVKILPVTATVQFTDEATAADYAAAAISRIARSGIVGGYPDGSFQPLGTITRAEAAKVLAQVIRLKEE